MKSQEISMKLGKRVKKVTCVVLQANMFSKSSLFLDIAFVQRHVYDTVKHVWQSFSAKIVNDC